MTRSSASQYNATVRLQFFVGKGGVGKTTVSASYAVQLARSHPRARVLVLSTDPAHSLADVLELRLGSKPDRLPLRGARLFAWQVDAQKEFGKFLGRQRDAILDLAASASIFSRKELEPLLDTTLPGMAEVAALLALHELLESGDYDHIVVDTAPLGHTLRLFQLPDHLARFLNFLETAASRDQVLAQTFGGRATPIPAVVSDWARMVESVRSALSASHAGLTVVTTPERFALNESLRAAQWMAKAVPRMKISGLVLNRAVTHASACARCKRRAQAARSAAQFLRRKFPRLPLAVGQDPGGPIMGLPALAAFGAHIFRRRKLTLEPKPPRSARIKLEPVSWPLLDTPLSLTVGKGGVGKTTISAALAVHQRAHRKDDAMVICSTDPAPSLDDVFGTEVDDQPRPVLGDPALRALEMDSVAEFERWSAELKERVAEALSPQAGALHLDLSFDRRLIIALLDVVPPGVDEIFALFRIRDLLAGPRGAKTKAKKARGAAPFRQRLLVDMAPTGHALELLRMPQRMLHWTRLLLKSLAPHRKLPLALDLAVEIAQVEVQARELAQALRTRGRSAIFTVMLPEPLPDRETGRLLDAVDDLGASARAIFVNRVLMGREPAGCPRCRRAQAWQMATLAGLRRRYRGRELYCAAEFGHELAGAQALKEFIRQLWRVV